MQTIVIPKSKGVRAAAAWEDGLSIFRKEKIAVVCGSCSRQFSNRDWLPMTPEWNGSRRIVSCCPHCGMWNVTKLVIDGSDE